MTGQTLPSIFSDSRCESDDEAEKEISACRRRLDHLYTSARTVLVTLYMKTKTKMRDGVGNISLIKTQIGPKSNFKIITLL